MPTLIGTAFKGPLATTRGDVFVEVSAGPSSEAPWVVLSNSLATTTGMWDEQIPGLVRRFNVLRYNTRGHLGSVGFDGPAGLDDLADDVVALLDAAGLDRVHFVGLSIGGMTGLGLAIRSPERLRSLVCSNAIASAGEAYRQGWVQRIAAVKAGGLGAISEETVNRWLAPDFRQRRPDRTQDLKTMVEQTPVEGYIGAAQALMRLDYGGGLGGISTPTLFIAGELDPGATPAVMADMAAATPGARLARIPGSAHVSCVDAPGLYGEALETFLK